MSELNDDWKWLEEPNKTEFEHAGVKCLILRDRIMWLGGYVGLEPGHPHFGKHFRDIEVKGVHRGLNFSGRGDGQRRKEGLWWIGFYCDRPGDYVPGRLDNLKGGEVYRNIEYVRGEVKKLAEQMRDAK
jgi:hypothetical protein